MSTPRASTSSSSRTALGGYTAPSKTNPAQGRRVAITNQFGTINLQIAQVKSVFVPANKSLVGPTVAPPNLHPTLDHFVCYVVKESGFVPIKNVQVQDQFGTLRANL